MYYAKLSNGTELTRASKRVYTHAWAVFENGQIKDSGFSSSETAAEKASRAQVNFLVSLTFNHKKEEKRKSLRAEVVECH